MRGVHHVETFLEMMAAEHGAARNTLDAYRRDLEDFAAFLSARGVALAAAATDDVRAYLADLAARGFAATSQARRLSALRRFHRFLYAEGVRGDDPTVAVDAPKKRRPLPKVLAEAEIGAILAAADGRAEDAAQPAAERARAARLSALAELAYATGMRVSELVGLPAGAARADLEFLTIRGKGGRERIVPLNPRAKAAITRYRALAAAAAAGIAADVATATKATAAGSGTAAKSGSAGVTTAAGEATTAGAIAARSTAAIVAAANVTAAKGASAALRDAGPKRARRATSAPAAVSRWLFPSTGRSGHLTRQGFARDLKAIAAVAGIAADRVSPHVVRHAFASHLLAGGADLRVVQTLLGHADIATTEIYTHVLEERSRALVETHHPLANEGREAVAVGGNVKGRAHCFNHRASRTSAK